MRLCMMNIKKYQLFLYLLIQSSRFVLQFFYNSQLKLPVGWYGARASKNALDISVVILMTSEASPAKGETAALVASPISEATRTAERSRSMSKGLWSKSGKNKFKIYKNQRKLIKFISYDEYLL